MPGFNIGGFGEGQTTHKIETRRAHRWKFVALGGDVFDQPAMLLLKSASRPSFTLEEPVMHHNEEQVYFAGKRSWETIDLSWYDAENDPDMSETILQWVLQVVDLEQANTKLPTDYKTEGNLDMLDGEGTTTETWRLFGCWPKDVKWNELDYETTDIMQITVTMRYDRALRQTF
jgi:hypothetical protein